MLQAIATAHIFGMVSSFIYMYLHDVGFVSHL